MDCRPCRATGPDTACLDRLPNSPLKEKARAMPISERVEAASRWYWIQAFDIHV
jgi:hypothetical protein